MVSHLYLINFFPINRFITLTLNLISIVFLLTFFHKMDYLIFYTTMSCFVVKILCGFYRVITLYISHEIPSLTWIAEISSIVIFILALQRWQVFRDRMIMPFVTLIISFVPIRNNSLSRFKLKQPWVLMLTIPFFGTPRKQYLYSNIGLTFFLYHSIILF